MDCFVILIETNPIVTDAEPVLGRIDAMEFFDVARTCLRKPLDGLVNAASCSFIESR